ncbi:MAG: PQQ-binding-like beta-propeller repeat protein [Gracilimonas sp.]|uniref:outer membrane protein assembly factor BamB family protein n=1 Tax=Gracilimonas sp. TaxID=1974203 RepID=UPI0019C4EA69|nr:PQQ-binding-like beta-propeller repeat protein [Gracilimonas sp.]MBD3615008.1 PQQ-binding-like beta-propeller repeat protein [Gracilimonas sp.]
MKIKLVLLLALCALTDCLFAQNNVLWKFETNDRVYSSPVTNGNLLYFGSGDHTFYAIHKETGEKAWEYKTKGAVHSTASIFDHIIYFASADGNLYALDKNDGSLIWLFQSEGEKSYDIWDYYLSDPMVYEDKVYWGSGDGHMYALNGLSGDLEWKYQTDDIIHASPVVADNQLYFGNYNGNFYSLNTENGDLIWKFKTIGSSFFPKGEIQKAAAIDNETVYFGSRDYNIYALSTKTGRGKWNIKTGSWVISTPLVYKENLFFGTSDSHIFYNTNKNNGKVNWEFPVEMRVYGSAVAHNEIIYFGSFDGKVYGVHFETGKKVWEFQTENSKKNYHTIFSEEGGFNEDFILYGEEYLESEKMIHSLGSILSTPLIDGNVIYFGSSDGNLYAISLE